MVIRRVAVTGASGFIGRHVVAHLADRGVEVVAVRRPFEARGLAASLRGADAVVHLAGRVSAPGEQDFIAANVEGTRAVAGAACTAGVRFVHISSLAAAGPAPASAPRSEADLANPITAYGRSKLEGERVLGGMSDLRWIVLRPGVVYGPGDRALLPLFQMATRGLLPLVGRAHAAYTVIHVTDAARAIAAALDSDADREAIFVGHPRPVTVREILDAVQGALGTRAAVVRVPMPIARVAAIAGDVVGALRGRPAVINTRRYTELAAEGFVCRVDRLRDRLGFVARIDLGEGLAQTASWYRSERWL
jgi:nucleoside-diphosphate-sugar epimerase